MEHHSLFTAKVKKSFSIYYKRLKQIQLKITSKYFSQSYNVSFYLVEISKDKLKEFSNQLYMKNNMILSKNN